MKNHLDILKFSNNGSKGNKNKQKKDLFLNQSYVLTMSKISRCYKEYNKVKDLSPHLNLQYSWKDVIYR